MRHSQWNVRGTLTGSLRRSRGRRRVCEPRRRSTITSNTRPRMQPTIFASRDGGGWLWRPRTLARHRLHETLACTMCAAAHNVANSRSPKRVDVYQIDATDLRFIEDH